MNKIIAGVITLAVLVSFFYFYQVKIFDAEITETSGTYHQELSFRSIFLKQDFPHYVDEEELISIQPTIKTWILTIAIFIGLPIMIGLRIGSKKSKDTNA